MRLPDWEAHLIGTLTAAAPGEEARGVAMYRNARTAILRNALAAAYPVCRSLVGEDCFDAVVRDTLATQTSMSPNLHRYGDALPGVVAQSPLAESVPYLADVARLEWCVHWAHYAPDAPVEALNASTLADMLARPADAIRAGLVDGARCVASSWPVAAIWRAHQPGANLSLSQIDLGMAGAAIVVVRGHHVAVLDIDVASAAFLAACEATPSLQAALETTLAQRPDFDLTGCLAGLYRAELLTLSACPAFPITHPRDMP